MKAEQNTLARGRSVRVRYAKTRVTVLQGPDAGATREIVSNSLRIGSSSDNDLVLTDNTVSRRHCAIEPVAGGVRVRDEGSTNGVRLSTMRVLDAVLNGPVHLQLGDTLIAIEPLSEQVAREQATADRFGDLLGGSPRMRELFADLEKIAGSDASLLIEGESGTGKELLADSVHRASQRAHGPLVVFDCSAVVPTLAESELFGQELGAFPGGGAVLPGAFEQAEGGTIVLDDIGELSPELQWKVLHVLERREVTRLGSQQPIAINVRFVAATNHNLSAEVGRGVFREDLYRRIAEAYAYIPPLRDRMEDLAMLVELFLSRAHPPRGLNDVPPQVWEMFNAHRWPGNVRELSNAVQRLLLTPEHALRTLIPHDSSGSSGILPAVSPDPIQPLRVARREASDAFELQYIEAVLTRTGGNITRAAAVADVSRQMIQKLLRKHGIG